MAGAGYKLFNTGDVLTAAQVNTYLQEQAVMRFANSTARTTALSGVLAEGMMSYLDDTNSVEVYNGSAWVSVGSTGDITEVLAGTGISGGGTSGSVTITNSMATAIDAKGDLVVGTGADTFARLAVGGTNGHTLQVDSSTSTGLKWAAASSGALVLINRSTFSNVAGVNIDNVFTSTYKTYLVVIEDLVGADLAADLYFQWRYGSTTQAASYYGNSAFLEYNLTTWTIDTINNANQITIARITDNVNAQIWCNQVGTGSDKAEMTGTFGAPNYWYHGIVGCGVNSAQTYTGFRLTASSNNITGQVTTYGLATA